MNAVFNIELRCRGKQIKSIVLNQLDKELIIGKSDDCDLRLPKEDHSSGEYHGKIKLISEGIKVVANDKYVIHFHGQALKEVIIKKADRLSVGDSELFISLGVDSAGQAKLVHQLEVIGGRNNGKIIKLEKDIFSIGTAPDNDLALDSDVVSKHHAKIIVKENGESWIKDLHSSNGVFVNGEHLGRQERMLMDSDEISIACFDYRFLDRNVVHHRAYFGKKIQVMGVTILLALLGFFLFYVFSPTTEKVMNKVEILLRQHNYDGAEEMLNQMVDSRGFQHYEKRYLEYRKQIPRYRKTWVLFGAFKAQLARSQWSDAIEYFGGMEIDDRKAWNQADPNTEQILKEVRQGKELLDIFLSLRGTATSLNTTVADLFALREKMNVLQKKWQSSQEKAPNYLNPLYQAIKEEKERLDFNVKSIEEVRKRLAILTEDATEEQLVELIGSLNKLQNQVSGIARVFTRDLIDMLQIVLNNTKDLAANEEALTDLRIEDVRPITLISPDECMKIPRLYSVSQKLKKRLQTQLQCRDNWIGISNLLVPYHLKLGEIPKEIITFSDEKLLEKVIGNGGINKEDMEAYNRIFGERYFYEVLQQTVHSTNNIYASDLIPDMRNVPKSIRLKDLYRAVSETLRWFRLPQNHWILRGKMLERYNYYCQILETRKGVLKVFENIASRNRDNRKYFIAKNAYFFFAPCVPEMAEKMVEFGKEWKKFRLKQQTYLENYDPMDEKGADEIRKTIIANGIPGDPVFNWVRSVK